MKPSRPDHSIAFGIFLATLVIYIATSPGRIDIVDGQSRYEAAYNWLLLGRPLVLDPILHFMAVPGPDGLPYGFYGAAGSLFGMPLVGLGILAGDSSGEIPRFLFSFTTPIFGALTAAVLFLFYRRLDVPPRPAAAWTCVAAFATLLWPGSVTAFDNVQHGFFVLAAVYLAHSSATGRSVLLAAAAGLVAGVPILYQEYFALLMPVLAIATLDFTVRERRIRLDGLGASGLRFAAFGAASAAGLILALAYNGWRFGSPLANGKLTPFADRSVIFSNPVTGLLALLVSPGKSIILYSPPVLLAVAGFCGLWRKRASLALAIVAAATIMLIFYSLFRFVGGDWCWGPRYLLGVLPLSALAYPFVAATSRWRKRAVIGIACAGLAVQVLAISVEHHRFFFERGIQTLFWEDPSAYFRHSALFARPKELVSLADGPPASARWFTTVRVPGYTTYSVLGPPPALPRERTPEWTRQFQVFYLPRPWPLWMWTLDAAQRPVNVPVALAALLAAGIAGVLQIREGLRDGSGGGGVAGRRCDGLG